MMFSSIYKKCNFVNSKNYELNHCYIPQPLFFPITTYWLGWLCGVGFSISHFPTTNNLSLSTRLCIAALTCIPSQHAITNHSSQTCLTTNATIHILRCVAVAKSTRSRVCDLATHVDKESFWRIKSKSRVKVEICEVERPKSKSGKIKGPKLLK